MPELNTYRRTCTICGASFATRCTNAKYCDKCRREVIKQKERRNYARKAMHREPTCTMYTCKRCGRRIKAHGRCTNRKIFDECLQASSSQYDFALLMQRKEVREEAIG